MRAIISFIVLIIELQVYLPAGDNYFVSTEGSNSNKGSYDLPWKSIRYGAVRLKPGDTLNILPGVYKEKISIGLSGNSLHRNVIRGLKDSVIIDGFGDASQTAVINIDSQSFITIEGLEIANNYMYDAQGILIKGACSNITIQNCKIHDIHFSLDSNEVVNENTNANGILVSGSDDSYAIQNIVIRDNELYNCRLGYSEGIAINGNVDGFEITGNIIHDLTNIGIDAIGHEGTGQSAATDQARNGLIKGNIIYNCISSYATSGGIYVDGGRDIVIENNISHHNGYGVEVGCEHTGKRAENIIVRNNIFYNNEVCAAAIGGFDYPNGSGKVLKCSFTNNTCYFNDSSGSGTGELYLTYSEYSVILNNIFYLSGANVIAYAELSQPGLNMDYNLFYSDADETEAESDWNGHNYTGFEGFRNGTHTNTNSKFSDPLFIRKGLYDPDFHLMINSPAIDAGNPMFLPSGEELDMDNEERVYNSVVDCGADEYHPAVGITQNEGDTKIRIFPNPSQNIIFIPGISGYTAYTIYDINGIEVRSGISFAGKINIGSLYSGVYLIRIHGDKYYTGLFIKE